MANELRKLPDSIHEIPFVPTETSHTVESQAVAGR